MKSGQNFKTLVNAFCADQDLAFGQLLDNPAFGYHSVDADGHFVYISDTELNWLGYKREEILGKVRFQDLLTTADRSRFERGYAKFKQNSIAKDVEFTYVRRDGTTMPISINAAAICDEQGKFLRSRSVVIDLTQRKECERMNKELALKQQREDLMALLTHDLKSALIGCQRGLELLRADSIPDAALREEILSAIRDANALVLQKIDTVLKIHTYDSEPRLNTGRVTLDTLVSSCVEELSQQCLEKSVQIVIDIDLVKPVRLDRHAWELVLKNLIMNAVQASPTGSKVLVRARTVKKHLEIQVVDNGRGISKEQQSKLFVRFWQGSATQRSPNVGMGLYLCSKIVSSYKGKISCESTPSNGATFLVEIPVKSLED